MLLCPLVSCQAVRHSVSLVMVLLVSSAAVAQSAQPTSEELHALYAQGKYGDVVQTASRLLQLRGEPAKAYDRYELLMLKADAQLQLKHGPLAADAYLAAAKETVYPADAARAAASAELIKRAHALIYTPKARDGEPPPTSFSLLDDAQRKPAMAALFEDEFTDLGPTIEAAMAATSLPTLMEAAAPIGNLDGLEMAVSGADKRTAARLAGLAERGKSLMNGAMDKMSKQVADISKSANEKVLIPIPPPPAPKKGERAPQIPDPIYRKRGVRLSEVATLRDAIDTCAKIEPASKEMATALHVEPASFDAVIARANDLRDQAIHVLHADYSGLFGPDEQK